MNKEKRAEMLGKDKISKALVTLSIPAIMGMMVSAIYNIVDTLFVSSLGTEALGAVTVVFPFFMLISAFGMTFGTGAASYISRLLGQKNVQRASQTVIVAFLSSIFFAGLFTVFGLNYLDRLLSLFGASPTILPYAKEYGLFIISGSVFTMGNMTLNNMLRAEGSAKMSMIGIMLGAILNIILDPIFIFALDMGVKGAALATVISQMISFGTLLGYYLLKKSFVEFRLRNFVFSGEIYGEILKIGLPTLLRQGLASVSMGMMNSAAVAYGDSAVAAIGVTSRIFMIAFYVIFGFSQGFQPLAGFNYGAKQYQRVQETIAVSVRWTTIYSVVMAVIYAVGATPIISVFSSDPNVLTIGTKLLRYYSLIFPTFGFTVIYNSAFMAFGKAKEALVLSTARQGIFLIPAILILPALFGLEGVLLCQPIANVLSFALTALLARRIRTELKDLAANEAIVKEKLVASS